MRFQFTRTGGFAGTRLTGSIDSATLPEDEVLTLKKELESARFFELPAQLGGGPGGADRFQYEITVEDGGKKHTIQAGESAIPSYALPLVHHLERLVRASR